MSRWSVLLFVGRTLEIYQFYSMILISSVGFLGLVSILLYLIYCFVKLRKGNYIILFILVLLLAIMIYIYNRKVNEPLYDFEKKIISRQEEIVDVKLMYGAKNRSCHVDIKIHAGKSEIDRKDFVGKIIYEINQEPFASFITRNNKEGDDFTIWLYLRLVDGTIRIESEQYVVGEWFTENNKEIQIWKEWDTNDVYKYRNILK